MVKRIQVFGICFILFLSRVYSIDLKHIENFTPVNKLITLSYGITQWVSNTEIFGSDFSETRIFDMKSRRSSLLFDPMKKVKVEIVFKNEAILLLRGIKSLKIERNNNKHEYYIYSLIKKRIYPIDKEGIEQYLADGGKEYEYHTLTLEEEKRWDYYLSCYKTTLPYMKSTQLWKEKAEDIFQTKLIGFFYPIEQYSDSWLVEMDYDLYLIQFDESGVKTSYKIQNDLGGNGVLLKDGRVLAPYCPDGEKSLYLGGDESYCKLAVFNAKGEPEQTIDKEIYVTVRDKMMSISPDRTKLLVMGYDKDHYNNWGVEINIYEIIYD